MKRVIIGILTMLLTTVLLFTTGVSNVYADARTKVVSLGANLNEEQRNEMLDLFKVDKDSVEILEVTNEEERSYLEGLISSKKIGTRAISSAYVEILDNNEGITVETHNIDWVTKEMYANAMVTAGIKNAKVIAAAPFQVSGTAALTGITKAFEEATGEDLSEEAKEAANEELVATGELGDDIGQENASKLIKEVKEKVIEGDISDPQEIRNIIIQIAGDLNINITDAHIDKLADLMEKISKLDLTSEGLAKQLENISGSIDKVRDKINKNPGFFQKIIDAIKSFFGRLADLLRG